MRIEHVFEIEEAQKDERGRPLLDCIIGHSIRWPKKQMEDVVEDVEVGKELEKGTSHFDFNDDVEINNDFLHREVQRNGLEKTQESTMETGDRSVRENVIMDGLPAVPQKREYMMTNRVPKCSRGRKIGHSRDEKCELQSVRAAKQSSEMCSKKCLVKITDKKILLLRFDAWSSNVYSERASWIVQHLTNAYVVIDNKNGMDKFDFKLDGQPICNGCYALALGYSKRCLEELKWNIRTSNERYLAIHGNSAKQPHALIQAEATRVAFERYVKECGCP